MADRGRGRFGLQAGFTLIELLIVIAIILILIAIALPNFLEAQLRAKYTKAQGELRTLMIAVESYSIDHNGKYAWDANETATPFSPFPGGRDINGIDWFSLMAMTTPIAYVREIPQDYFQDGNEVHSSLEPFGVPYLTYNYHETVSLQRNPANGIGANNIGAILEGYGVRWVLFGIGPDKIWQVETMSHFNAIRSVISSKSGGSDFSYSPTNGTKSLGDIFRSNVSQR